MGASGRAAVGVVAELVDVHASLGIGVIAGDVVGDGGWGGFIGLLEGYLTCDLGVSSEDSDCGEGVSMVCSSYGERRG